MTELQRLLADIRSWQVKQPATEAGVVYDVSELSKESDDLLDYL